MSEWSELIFALASLLRAIATCYQILKKETSSNAANEPQ
jgi:hypothetical protein